MVEVLVIAEQALEQLAAERAHFADEHAQLAVESIVAGHTGGRLWRAGAAAQQALLLWDQGNNVLYLAGQPAPDQIASLADLIATQIGPASLALGRAYVKLRALSPAFEPELPALVRGSALRELHSRFYRYQRAQAPAVAHPNVAGLQLLPIDRALLTDEAIGNRESVRNEIAGMWPSLERFLTHGFGCAALVEQQLVCWCTAEYVGPTGCGIGIATEPAYQGQGIATAAAAHMLGQCLARGLAAHWECGTWNAPSMRLAEKLGFTLLATERAWVVDLTPSLSTPPAGPRP